MRWAEGGVRKSILRTHNQADAREKRRSAPRGVFAAFWKGRRRETRRSGADAQHGLNEAQQDCRALHSSPTCARAHTHPPTSGEAGRHARGRYRNLSLEVQSHFSPSQPFASIRPSNAHKHGAHAQAHFSSSLASTSITLRSSSLRFPSPLAICSFINHDSVRVRGAGVGERKRKRKREREIG